ncbi:hypothetical protein [Virgisporangium aliadipatigenens]|nr:hypothetical protein [Virgisporangium aliadipatigenens]
MRAMVGSRALGWRGDMRADSPITQRGRTYVPMLTEHDWYRAEEEQLEVFAPLVPIERVWIELVGYFSDSDPSGPDAPLAIPVGNERRIAGRRIVHVPPENGKEERDLRAISEIFSVGYETFVLTAREADWYRWAWSGKIPAARRLTSQTLWVE